MQHRLHAITALKYEYCKHQAIPEHTIAKPAHQPETIAYHSILTSMIKRHTHIAIKLMHAV
jgi:CBS domain containing-hemolysin-like protein